jgi:hypothetical protein
MMQYRYAHELPALPPGRHLAAALLHRAARALAAVAEHIAARAAEREAIRHREFEVVEQDGALVGMLYEDGRLVALLPDIGRL